MHHRWVRSLAVFALTLACRSIAAQGEAPPEGEATSWAFAHVARLQDLSALDGVIGKARVIGFSEYAHQQPECLELRNRLFEHLVSSHGVTAIAAETSYVRSIPADDYVLGRGPAAAPREAVHGVFAWSPHVADENRHLLEWMRAYNAANASGRKLRFYGIDLTGYRPGKDVFEHARESADLALAYVAKLEPQAARTLRRRLEPGLAHFTRATYARLSPVERDALTAALNDLANLFAERQSQWLKRTSPLEYGRAHRSLQISLQHDRDFRASAQPGGAINTAREVAMADNLRWVLEQEGPSGRVLLFASFDHLTRGPNPDFHDGQLGAHLARMLGNDYVAIASYWLRERAELTSPGDAGALADEILRPVAARLSYPLGLLNLRSRPFDSRWSHRNGTPSFFDAVLFLDVKKSAPRW